MFCFLLGNCNSVVAIDLLWVSQAFSPLWCLSVAWGFVPELLWPSGLLNRNRAGTGTVVLPFPWPIHSFGNTMLFWPTSNLTTNGDGAGKLRAEVACEQSLLFLNDCSPGGCDVDPPALIALRAWMLRVLVALAALLLTGTKTAGWSMSVQNDIKFFLQEPEYPEEYTFFSFPEVLPVTFAPKGLQTWVRSWLRPGLDL